MTEPIDYLDEEVEGVDKEIWDGDNEEEEIMPDEWKEEE